MQFIIKSKEIKISQDLNLYIQKRIGKLEKFLTNVDPNLISSTIEISRISKQKQGQIYQIGVSCRFPGNFFRFETRDENLYAAIDKAKDELEIEIQKFKEKRGTLFKRGARSFKKKFRLSPMARFRNK